MAASGLGARLKTVQLTAAALGTLTVNPSAPLFVDRDRSRRGGAQVETDGVLSADLLQGEAGLLRFHDGEGTARESAREVERVVHRACSVGRRRLDGGRGRDARGVTGARELPPGACGDCARGGPGRRGARNDLLGDAQRALAVAEREVAQRGSGRRVIRRLEVVGDVAVGAVVGRRAGDGAQVERGGRAEGAVADAERQDTGRRRCTRGTLLQRIRGEDAVLGLAEPVVAEALGGWL